MTIRVKTLASGQGWSVSDVVCLFGPPDRPFEEQHRSVYIAAVMHGSFRSRTTGGAATLVPGAILLGNHESCFECGHDHGAGDHCLSFMFDPTYFEAILSASPGVRTAVFPVPRLPPLMSFTRIFADAVLARYENDPVWLEQLALDLAGAVSILLADTKGLSREGTRRDEQRIAGALRAIGADASTTMGIGDLAREVGMSPYHFLRVFRAVVGMTPHQFILRTRLQNAAIKLRRSSEPVMDVAFDTGFSDLSTFNRRFRSIMGMTPSDYRQRDRTGRATSARSLKSGSLH